MCSFNFGVNYIHKIMNTHRFHPLRYRSSLLETQFKTNPVSAMHKTKSPFSSMLTVVPLFHKFLENVSALTTTSPCLCSGPHCLTTDFGTALSLWFYSTTLVKDKFYLYKKPLIALHSCLPSLVGPRPINLHKI